MSEWKIVSKDEFDAFVDGYPTQLERDVTLICEPPMISDNDFKGGKVWPESMVARTWLVDDYPGREPEYQVRAAASIGRKE